MATNPPIIEVYIDDKGGCSYKLRPCDLSAPAYGLLLADVAMQIAMMFEMESKGKFTRAEILEVIREYFGKEIARPTSEITFAVTH
jgi:hypothetical protein